MSGTTLVRLLHAAVFAAACALFAASLTPMMPFSVFLSDIPSHFPVYILIAAPLLAASVFTLRLPAFLILPAMIAAGASFVQVYPFLPLRAPLATTTASFKLLQINVYTDNHETAPLAALIEAENPDIVVIAELNRAFVLMSENLKNVYPHRYYHGKTAVLSRLPLETISLDEEEAPLSTPQFFRASLSGHSFTLSTFHAAAPPLGLVRRDLEFAEYAALVKRLRQTERIKYPLVFAGDINVTPYAPAMKNLSAEMQVKNAREGIGLLHSWPVWLPAPLRIPIDHVLVSKGISVLEYRLGPAVGSDHLPTIAVLGLPARP